MSTPAKRYTVLPMQHPDIWDLYKKQIACFWTAEEIDFSQDEDDWKHLKEEERQFLLHILAFFAVSDSVVMDNLVQNFCQDAPCLEATFFYTFQAAMEGIHAETYALMLDKFSDGASRDKLFRAVEEMPTVASKVKFAEKWMDPERPYGERVLAFAVVEGLLFSASFASIFWLKQHSEGKMPGLCFSNELISRDEGQHCDFAVHLFKHHLQRPVAEERVREIIMDGLAVELEFVDEALKDDLLGMNKDLMRAYVKFVANRLCEQLIHASLDDTQTFKNPFDWMTMISLTGKTNFFERRVSEYNKAGVGETNEEAFDFGEDDVF